MKSSITSPARQSRRAKAKVAYVALFGLGPLRGAFARGKSRDRAWQTSGGGGDSTPLSGPGVCASCEMLRGRGSEMVRTATDSQGDRAGCHPRPPRVLGTTLCCEWSYAMKRSGARHNMGCACRRGWSGASPFECCATGLSESSDAARFASRGQRLARGGAWEAMKPLGNQQVAANRWIGIPFALVGQGPRGGRWGCKDICCARSCDAKRQKSRLHPD